MQAGLVVRVSVIAKDEHEYGGEHTLRSHPESDTGTWVRNPYRLANHVGVPRDCNVSTPRHSRAAQEQHRTGRVVYHEARRVADRRRPSKSSSRTASREEHHQISLRIRGCTTNGAAWFADPNNRTLVEHSARVERLFGSSDNRICTLLTCRLDLLTLLGR